MTSGGSDGDQQLDPFRSSLNGYLGIVIVADIVQCKRRAQGNAMRL